jgi:hypothetical protein
MLLHSAKFHPLCRNLTPALWGEPGERAASSLRRRCRALRGWGMHFSFNRNLWVCAFWTIESNHGCPQCPELGPVPKAQVCRVCRLARLAHSLAKYWRQLRGTRKRLKGLKVLTGATLCGCECNQGFLFQEKCFEEQTLVRVIEQRPVKHSITLALSISRGLGLL